MALTPAGKANTESVLKKCLRDKFLNYSPETKYMPFHARLLGSDRLALYSFNHSLNTNFGSTFFEQVAVTIATPRFKWAEAQCKIGDKISEAAQSKIQAIIDNLSTAKISPNKNAEIEELRTLCQQLPMRTTKPTRVDLFLENASGELYLFDIKTAKPNAGDFKAFKRTLLEWAAIALAKAPTASINTLIAIPYNPYHPEPYNRWTIRGMLDLDAELMVAEEFWDFLGGDGTFSDLLTCFENVGIELKDEIDQYFSRFNLKRATSTPPTSSTPSTSKTSRPSASFPANTSPPRQNNQ